MSPNLPLKILSYAITLFPSVAVISVYPLYVITLVNNIHNVLFCQDVSQAPNTRKNFFIQLIIKFVVAMAPILLAMAVSNLVTVLKYAGLSGFLLCLFPALLQVRSQWVCSKTFKRHLLPSNRPHWWNFLTLSSQRNYMTPYSNVCSYWPVVTVTILTLWILLICTIASFFI